MSLIGKNINILRNAFGINQDDLGKAIKASKSKVSRFESGADVPPYELGLIAQFFGCSISDIELREISVTEAETLATRAKTRDSNLSMLASEDESGYRYKSKPESQAQNEIEVESEDYDVKLAVHVGKVINEILTRHQAPREAYAKRALKRHERTLQRIIKGEIMATLPLAIKIATDFGESLDVFRPGPLPKGHMLRTIADQERVITAQAELIAALRK